MKYNSPEANELPEMNTDIEESITSMSQSVDFVKLKEPSNPYKKCFSSLAKSLKDVDSFF